MSTFNYPGTRATVLRLLVKFGNAITLDRKKDGSAFDPGTGGKSGGTTTVLNGTGVLLKFHNKEIDGSNIKATDRKLLFQGDALLINDLFNGWRVHAINNLDPDESGTILTTAQLRK